jgi:outer membrane receptor for ferrienterochelin and colicins
MKPILKKLPLLFSLFFYSFFGQNQPDSKNNEPKNLEEVVIRAKKTTVEIKLDKKIYNVGQDLMVKGGTISDILNNIPSITVDSEGLVSLRGNEGVTIQINGKPTTANNIADVLRQIPAETIDKVEIINNPSARYDAEGSGGIINIVLKKGKVKGINGTITANSGFPENTGVAANLNYKKNKTNFFTTQGYNYKVNIGKFLIENNYLNPEVGTPKFISDSRRGEKYNRTYNGTVGLDWSISPKTVWTNTLGYRRNTADAEDKVTFDNRFDDPSLNFFKYRKQNEESKQENIDLVTNWTTNFEKPGHKWSVDGQFSSNKEGKAAVIGTSTSPINDFAVINQKSRRFLLQTDYVLPFQEGVQLELGYRLDNLKQSTDAQVINGTTVNDYFSGTFEYDERVNAAYSQFGYKKEKYQFLAGLRFEDSNIQINQPSSNYSGTKKYQNFFPNTLLSYSVTDQSSITLSYSRRIQRPRDRVLNPFSNIASDINVYRGNLDLNPSLSDVFDLGIIKRFDNANLSASTYYNSTKSPFVFFRRLSGELVNDVPLIIVTPINLEKTIRIGFDVNYNFGIAKWWKMNTNFNLFQIETIGKNESLDLNNQVLVTDFGLKTVTWFTKINSKITLPNKIEWQTNFNFTGPQETNTGKVYAAWGLNLGFSKDVMKDKGTVAMNVSDLFNTQRRIFDSRIPNSFDSYANLLFRVRQITFAFTYRFNRQKSEKEKARPRNQENEGGDF